MTKNDLYQRILESRDKIDLLQFKHIGDSDFDFNEYYKLNSSILVKCSAWILHGEPYKSPLRNSIQYGFSKDDSDKSLPPDFIVDMPLTDAEKVSTQEGYAERLLFFVGYKSPNLLNIYFGKPSMRKLSKKDLQEIIEELDCDFPDSLFED